MNDSKTSAAPEPFPSTPNDLDDLPPGEWRGPELRRALQNLALEAGWKLTADHDSGDHFTHWYGLDGSEKTWALDVELRSGKVAARVYRDAPKVVAFGENGDPEPDSARTFLTAERAAPEVAWLIWSRLGLAAAGAEVDDHLEKTDRELNEIRADIARLRESMRASLDGDHERAARELDKLDDRDG